MKSSPPACRRRFCVLQLGRVAGLRLAGANSSFLPPGPPRCRSCAEAQRHARGQWFGPTRGLAS
jgi:hypothetical protein